MKNQKATSENSVRRLLSLAKQETRWLLLGTLFLALGSGTSLLFPQMIRAIIDEALGSRRLERVDRAAAIMLALFLVQGIAAALRYYLFTISGERIVLRLRRMLFEKLMHQEIGFFDSRRTGELMSRLSSDTTVLQSTLSVNISMGVRNLAAAVGGLGLLVYTSPVLTLTVLAVVPPIAFGGAFFGRRIRRLSRDAQDALADAGTVAEETISGIRTVRAFSQESYEVERYARSLTQSFNVARTRIYNVSIFTGAALTLGYSAIAAVLWYGGRLVIRGEMSVGHLTSFLIYMLIVAFAVGALGSLWTDFMSAIGASRRIFELLDREAEIPHRGGEQLAQVRGKVTFANVTFAYPSRPEIGVLENVSVTIPPDSLVALVGASGSGKTTIASLIPRFYDPSSGTISIDDHDVKTLDGEWLRRQIGIVAQEPILVSETIFENIRYGRPTASYEEIVGAARAANAHDFIQRFPEKYQTRVGERGIQLSGGQKQRVAIARAVLKNPRILILDEATSALDAESEHLVQEALDRLMQGRTTLVIAHRLSTVRNAQLVLVVDRGKIVQSGTHDSLMHDPLGIYYRLVERQFVKK